MITGLNHITLSVKSLSESFIFYRDVLGFKPLLKNNKSAYFLVGDLWFCIEEDASVRANELPEYTHIAFSVDQRDFDVIQDKMDAYQVKRFKENKSEGDSIYFVDPNGHKLEIHVGSWKTRVKSYLGDPKCEFFISDDELRRL